MCCVFGASHHTLVGTYDQSGETVYTMGLCGDRLVVGTSNRKVRWSSLHVWLGPFSRWCAGSCLGLEEHAVCRAEKSFQPQVPDEGHSLLPKPPRVCAELH